MSFGLDLEQNHMRLGIPSTVIKWGDIPISLIILLGSTSNVQIGKFIELEKK